MPSLVRIGSVDVSLGEGQEENLMDYSLSKSAPTMETVEEVMQLFESGGQASQSVGSQSGPVGQCGTDQMRTEQNRLGARRFLEHFGSVLAASFLRCWLR